MDEAFNYKWLNRNAIQHQRFMRFVTFGSMGYPVFGATMWLMPSGTPMVFFSALGGAIFSYLILHNRFGHVANWWWMRRGSIITIRDFDKLDEAKNWLELSDYQYVEITTGSFKFYDRSTAVLFKLSWV